MKKKLSEARGSLFSLMIKNYILFTFATIIVFVILAEIYTAIADRYNDYPQVEKFYGMINEWNNGEYSKIASENLLGFEGYFEVLDSTGKVIYRSSSVYSERESYSLKELDLINDWNDYSGEQLQVNPSNDGTQIILERMTQSEDYTYKSEITIVNLDGSVAYTTDLTGKQFYTPEEMNILNDRKNSKFWIQKISYTGKDGETFYVLAHIDSSVINGYDNREGIIVLFMGAFLMLYIIQIIGFGFWLRVKLKKPLYLLNDAILGIAEGKRDVMEYRGPVEFAEIVDSYNQMSIRLRESEEQQQHLEFEKNKMLADISHDLKTPVTVIQGYAKAVADGMVPKDREKYYLEVIAKKAELMTELIESFHEYSKMEHPDFSFTMERTDVCEFLRKYLAEKYQELELANVKMEINIPEKPYYINADTAMLRRIFENLIGNSMKYNTQGVSISVELTVSNDNKYTEIRFSDNGTGIPVHIRDHIFEPFITGNEARTAGTGSGLGLALVKKIVDGHNGSIRLEENKGIPESKSDGAEFVITFPLIL